VLLGFYTYAILYIHEQSYTQLNLYQFRQVTGSLVKQHKWYKWEQLNQKLKQEHLTVAAPPELRPLWLPCPCTRLTHAIHQDAQRAEIVHVRFRAPELVHERLMERPESWDDCRNLVLVRQDCAPDMDRPRGLVIASQRRSSDNEIAKEVQNQL